MDISKLAAEMLLTPEEEVLAARYEAMTDREKNIYFSKILDKIALMPPLPFIGKRPS